MIRAASRISAFLWVMVFVALVAVVAGGNAARADEGDLAISWVGDTMHLDWRGATTTTTQDSFLGDRVVSPGDHVARTISITNSGAGEGKVSVRITEPVVSAQNGVGELSSLSWRMGDVSGTSSLGGLLKDRTMVTDFVLARGESEDFTLTYDFPIGATGGNRAASGTFSTAQFDIEVSIRGAGKALVDTNAMTAASGWLVVGWGMLGGGVVLVLVALRRRRQQPDASSTHRQ